MARSNTIRMICKYAAMDIIHIAYCGIRISNEFMFNYRIMVDYYLLNKDSTSSIQVIFHNHGAYI